MAGVTFTVNQAGVCVYTLSPSAGSYPSAGANGSFTVNSNPGCAWTAASGASWIRILSSPSGSGSGQVSFALDPNIGDARASSITVAGQTFTVAQGALVCSITLTPGAANVPAGGGAATFNVSTPASCAWSTTTAVTWITIITGASGSGPGVVGISADANSGADPRTGTVTVGAQNFTVMQPGPSIQISLNSIANAATNVSGAVSPGLSVVISVPGIGPADRVDMQLSDDGLFVTTQLGDTRILFDGIAAPMLYAASGQFGAIVPYEVAGQDSTQLQVEFQGVRSNSVTVPVALSSPGLFPLAFDPQGNPNSADNPAPVGTLVTLYATGEGQTIDSGIDGKLAQPPYPQPVLPVSVSIDGIDAAVSYAGGAAGQVAGLVRIDVTIPDGAHSGAIPVLLKVGPFQSQTGVTVVVQ